MNSESNATIAAIRRFNRMYTRSLNLLGDDYLQSAMPLADVRVLYEIAHGEVNTAKGVSDLLRLDAGYVSRIIDRLVKSGLVEKKRSLEDKRLSILTLTTGGAMVIADLEEKSNADIRVWLDSISEVDQRKLVGMMQGISDIVQPIRKHPTPIIVREHRPGDMGWIVSKHAQVYTEEFGWDATFEAVVARIAADFLDNYDPLWERCWIAERDGIQVGSIALVRHPELEGVAKLRLLIVDESTRGSGLGKQLVETCIGFAKSAGYHTVTLWTYAHLTAATRIYERAGFELVAEEDVFEFGKEMKDQTWQLSL